MKTIKTQWTGIRPLVMHNGILADPTNQFARRIAEINGKRKKTEADHEQRNHLEWEGSLYWSEDDGLVMASDNIERCIQLGAQKSRLGKDVQAAVFCSLPEVPIKYEGPKTKEKLYADPRFSLRKGVRVQASRIIRVRPMVPTGWSIQFELEFDESVVNEKAVVKAMQDAGALVGLGDWRPKFGRFTVEVFE